jgi:hypothetical protein
LNGGLALHLQPWLHLALMVGHIFQKKRQLHQRHCGQEQQLKGHLEQKFNQMWAICRINLNHVFENNWSELGKLLWLNGRA